MQARARRSPEPGSNYAPSLAERLFYRSDFETALELSAIEAPAAVLVAVLRGVGTTGVNAIKAGKIMSNAGMAPHNIECVVGRLLEMPVSEIPVSVL